MKARYPDKHNKHQAFTLIELLTVIAIIAILAAIVFPVFSQIRNKVRESTTMSQMHEIGQATKLYFADNEKYPVSLLGYVQTPSSDSTEFTQTFYTGQSGQLPLKIEQLTYRPLTTTQKYLKDKDVFLGPNNTFKDPTAITTAVYPDSTMLPTPLSEVAGENVVFSPLMLHNVGRDDLADSSKSYSVLNQPAYFYKYDSYDVGPQVVYDPTQQKAIVKQGSDGPVMELHYSIDWTGRKPGDSSDAINQLKYRNPPEDRTVITWSTYEFANANSDKIPVLFLDGRVKPIPADEFTRKGPLGLRR